MTWLCGFDCRRLQGSRDDVTCFRAKVNIKQVIRHILKARCKFKKRFNILSRSIKRKLALKFYQYCQTSLPHTEMTARRRGYFPHFSTNAIDSTTNCWSVLTLSQQWKNWMFNWMFAEKTTRRLFSVSLPFKPNSAQITLMASTLRKELIHKGQR